MSGIVLLGIAIFLRLRRQFAFVARDVRFARCDQFYQFGVTRGHWLTLPFQTLEPLARCCDRQTQIVPLLERLFFLGARTFLVFFGVNLRGFLLSDDDALVLMKEWNAACDPPWTDRELTDKIRRARRYGREPLGGLLEGSQ